MISALPDTPKSRKLVAEILHVAHIASSSGGSSENGECGGSLTARMLNAFANVATVYTHF